MRTIPICVLRAAKSWEPEAVEYVRKHFEGYIIAKSQVTYEDCEGRLHSYVDDDLKYCAEIAVLRALTNFKFRDPPA